MTETSILIQKLRSRLQVFFNKTESNEKRAQAAQDVRENLDSSQAASAMAHDAEFPAFVQEIVDGTQTILHESQPSFLQDSAVHQQRRLCLELLHRLPNGEHMRVHVRTILSLVFKLVEYDNEENALLCLKMIIEQHKYQRPQYTPEISGFLKFVREVYRELQNQTSKIFEPRAPYTVSSLQELHLDTLVLEVFATTIVQVTNSSASAASGGATLYDETGGGTNVASHAAPPPSSQSLQPQPTTYTILPKSCYSLKVMQEMPIVVVLMYQLYKQQVHQEVSEFIPLILTFINLQPEIEQRRHKLFNKAVYMDFVAAQVKTLSFLAYIVRIYQDAILAHHQDLVRGMLKLLRNCPPEIASMRKELFIAARHILNTDLRKKFVSIIDHLYDESILLGSGYTVHDSQRPLAYSTLADLAHHVRMELSLSSMAEAVNMFGRNVHDDTLPTSIQVMSFKLVLNLVDCIRQRAEADENPQGRDLLMKILYITVLKFRVIAVVHVPALLAKCTLDVEEATDASSATAAATASTQRPTNATTSIKSPPPAALDVVNTEANCNSNGASGAENALAHLQVVPYAWHECRSMMKTLICGVKTIVWNITSFKVQPPDNNPKQLRAKDIRYFIQLSKYAFKALDIYMISQRGNDLFVRPSNVLLNRAKDEKEILEHLAGVYHMLSPIVFREIFSSLIDYFMERMKENVALQIIANSILAHPATSSSFATLMLDYLLQRLEELGNGTEVGALYLKLFKLVFGSVSLIPHENEQMLKPHLHSLVNRSIELAMTSKDPYNYFLLLRALFRSIGGGNHDVLYQEFLPLLPNLLQTLNNLQSSPQKVLMKDLFVELCLTVPVRLSSLLPYLNLLMDPLVSALNGSQTLVGQGLRTLELCVDNLQPDFLYDQIHPVRADMMQALWNGMRSPVDTISLSSFRVLGKFGGSNRKVISEPQRVNFVRQQGPEAALLVHFVDEPSKAVALPLTEAVEAAINQLETGSCVAASNGDEATAAIFYAQRSCVLLLGYWTALLTPIDEAILATQAALLDADIKSFASAQLCTEALDVRRTAVRALGGLLLAMRSTSLCREYGACVATLVRHLTLSAVCLEVQQNVVISTTALDPYVLIDALAEIFSHEDKELCGVARAVLLVMYDTALAMLGTRARVSQLALFDYAVERLSQLCYDRGWFTKWGGCDALKQLLQLLDLTWIVQHQARIARALFYVTIDLMGEIGQGAGERAAECLRMLVDRVCESSEATAAADPLLAELVAHLSSVNPRARKLAMDMLHVISERVGLCERDLLEKHSSLVEEALALRPPLRRYAVARQAAYLDVIRYCLQLQPAYLRLELEQREHHKALMQELVAFVETPEESLRKMPCYANNVDISGLRVLVCQILCSIWSTGPEEGCDRKKLFEVLFKCLCSEVAGVHEAAFKCLSRCNMQACVDVDTLHNSVKPIISNLRTWDTLTAPVLQKLSYCAQVFPSVFTEKLCESLQNHLQPLLDELIKKYKAAPQALMKEVLPKEMVVCQHMVAMFGQIPAASSKHVERLISIVLQTEQALHMEPSSPLRAPLVPFLAKFASETVAFLLLNNDPHYQRFLGYLMLHANGEPFHRALHDHIDFLRSMLSTVSGAPRDVQYLAVHLLNSMMRRDTAAFLSTHSSLLRHELLSYWICDAFAAKHRNLTQIDQDHWNEPRLVAQMLLAYFKANMDEVEVLFQLLRAYTDRFMCPFDFLQDYLLELHKSATVAWKRRAFFCFKELHVAADWDNLCDLKVQILKMIVIPAFSTSFYKNEHEALIGGRPAPESNAATDLVNIFVNEMLPLGKENDGLRIHFMKLACVLVEHAAPWIHDVNHKKQGLTLRRLMTYAWPCLVLSQVNVDPITRYHGHLLLAHIISKFAINKKIVIQVFHSLLKAHHIDAKKVVNGALDILTPAMSGRMENDIILHWTKKMLNEDVHNSSQQSSTLHILGLLVRQASVYYPVRQALLSYIYQGITKFGFSQTSSTEHKRLALDLIETVIKWDRRFYEEQQFHPKVDSGSAGGAALAVNPIEKVYRDQIMNALLRFASNVTEAAVTNPALEVLNHRPLRIIEDLYATKLWADAELKLTFFDRILSTMDTPNASAVQVNAALELLFVLLSHMSRDQILGGMRHLTKGLSHCLRSLTNPAVSKACVPVVNTLFMLFPPEPASSSKLTLVPELVDLYSNVMKVISDGFQQYERTSSTTNPATAQLSSAMRLLRATQSENNCAFVDRLITTFGKLLNRVAKETFSTSSTTENTAALVELLVVGFDIVKNRMNVMSVDTRRGFLQLLGHLIDKSTEKNLIRAIIRLVRDWVYMTKPEEHNLAPTCKEKHMLLLKVMHKLTSGQLQDEEFVNDFLCAIYHVFSSPYYQQQDLYAKLEPAFNAGLLARDPNLRHKVRQFYLQETFLERQPLNRRLDSRLMFVVTQRWDSFGDRFWIPVALDVLLSAVQSEGSIMGLATKECLLPNFLGATHEPSFAVKHEPMESINETLVGFPGLLNADEQDLDQGANARDFCTLIRLQTQGLNLLRKQSMSEWSMALCDLCHTDTALCQQFFTKLFPRLWEVVRERLEEAGPMVARFVVSGCHNAQLEVHPNPLATFMSGVMQCADLMETMPAPTLAYFGSFYHMWHRVVLLLEGLAADPTRSREAMGLSMHGSVDINCDYQECLVQMYTELKEEDYLCAVWGKRSQCREMFTALSLAQQGLYQKAAEIGEEALEHGKADGEPAVVRDRFIDDHLIHYLKQLNRWQDLPKFAQAQSYSMCNYRLVAEAAWKLADWRDMHNALSALGSCEFPRWEAWKHHLLWGYWSLCGRLRNEASSELGNAGGSGANNSLLLNPSQQQHVDRYFKNSMAALIKEWKRLPRVVTNLHVTYLQATQQIIELQEAGSLFAQISSHLLGRAGAPAAQNNLTHDMKAIVKTWRNRLPVVSDDLSHWNEILLWRQHVFQDVNRCCTTGILAEAPLMHQMRALCMHSTVQSVLQFSKTARKQHLFHVSSDGLDRLYQVPDMAVNHCFLKIKQEFKSRLDSMSNKREEIVSALQFMEQTNLKYFSTNEKAEFFSYKAVFFALLNKGDEANKNHSYAIQLADNVYRVWAQYGDFLESVFTREPPGGKREPQSMTTGSFAMQCFMEAAKVSLEPKVRRHIAKCIWLLSYDDAAGTLARCLEERAANVQPGHFLTWIPNLLLCLLRPEGLHVLGLLSTIARQFPTAVYIPVCTLTCLLREDPSIATPTTAGNTPSAVATAAAGGSAAAATQLYATQLMGKLRDLHASQVGAVQHMYDSLHWLRASWAEEVQYRIRRALQRAYFHAFEKRADVADTRLTDSLARDLQELAQSFGVEAFGAKPEIRARALAEAQRDPDYLMLKEQFAQDMELCGGKLSLLITKLARKWLKLMQAKVKEDSTVARGYFLLEERSRFLAAYSGLQNLEVELPGEHQEHKPSQHLLKVARFLPRVEVFVRNGTTARRVRLRASNGKRYAYLVERSGWLNEGMQEARVMQLFRLLNPILAKERQSAQRLLCFSTLRLVEIGRGLRLVEDQHEGMSLLDVHHSLSSDPEFPVLKYYDKMASVQKRNSSATHNLLREVHLDTLAAQGSHGLQRYVRQSLPDPTDYWYCRIQLTRQLGLLGLAEFVFHLTGLYPWQLILHLMWGRVSAQFFRWDLHEDSGQLAGSRAVPMRLTPNLVELLTINGIDGPMQAGMVAAARCLALPKYQLQSYLKPLLRDEIIDWHRASRSRQQRQLPSDSALPAQLDGNKLVTLVNQACTSITTRLNNLALYENGQSRVSTLLMAGMGVDNLCRMDPSWYPWL